MLATERANLYHILAAATGQEWRLLWRRQYHGSLGAGGGVQMASAGSPLVVVRFERPNVDYQQVLYAALNQALARELARRQLPGRGGFRPARGSTAASVQLAQTVAAPSRQEDVMRSMSEQGVPAPGMGVALTTDPAAPVSEVRVFVR